METNENEIEDQPHCEYPGCTSSPGYWATFICERCQRWTCAEHTSIRAPGMHYCLDCADKAEGEDILHLSERDAQALMEALDNPGPPPPKLVEAAARYTAWMGESTTLTESQATDSSEPQISDQCRKHTQQ